MVATRLGMQGLPQGQCPVHGRGDMVSHMSPRPRGSLRGQGTRPPLSCGSVRMVCPGTAPSVSTPCAAVCCLVWNDSVSQYSRGLTPQCSLHCSQPPQSIPHRIPAPGSRVTDRSQSSEEGKTCWAGGGSRGASLPGAQLHSARLTGLFTEAAPQRQRGAAPNTPSSLKPATPKAAACTGLGGGDQVRWAPTGAHQLRGRQAVVCPV